MEPKFNLNRQPVSDEEINSKKDFGELIKQFKKQSIEKARTDENFFKNKKVTYSTIIAGVAVLCTVTYFAVFNQESSKKIAHEKTFTKPLNSKPVSGNKSYISPPISKLNIPYSTYRVKTEKGATIIHKNSSKIIIPKHAFIDKKGNDIVGDVEIKYREFHNQADIIVSGIPMIYDSAGVQSHFESAGMIDIKGYQNNEPVYIKPDKKITVEFISEQTADKYNMYFLDTISKNWAYIKRDNSLIQYQKEIESKNASLTHQLTNVNTQNIIELEKQIKEIPQKIEQEKNDYSKKINQLPKITSPNKPAQATEGKPKFELDVDYKEFPELAVFKHAVFEVGAENKNYNPKVGDITWSSAEISQGPVKGKNYELTLKLKDKVEKLIVYPVLTGTNYEKALKIYESKFNEYQKLILKRETEELRLKNEFETKQATYKNQEKQLSDRLVKEKIKQAQQKEIKLDEDFKELGTLDKVTRIFEISKFGIYNSDCTNQLPQNASLHAFFITNKEKIHLKTQAVYLICHSKNLVYHLPNGPIPYNPGEVYSICVLANNKLYMCDKGTFATVIASHSNKILLTELDNIQDAFELKKAIGI